MVFPIGPKNLGGSNGGGFVFPACRHTCDYHPWLSWI
jgi:hypothetical protein